MRPPSPRNVPLTRSMGAHPEDQRPKTKLRFPDVTGIQRPPVRIVSKPKAKAEPVVIQPPAPVAPPGQVLPQDLRRFRVFRSVRANVRSFNRVRHRMTLCLSRSLDRNPIRTGRWTTGMILQRCWPWLRVVMTSCFSCLMIFTFLILSR